MWRPKKPLKLQAKDAWEKAEIAKEKARKKRKYFAELDAEDAEKEARKKEMIAEELSQRALRMEEQARKKEIEEQKKRVEAGKKAREERKKRQRIRQEAVAAEEERKKREMERDEAVPEEEWKRARKESLLRKVEKVRRESAAKKRAKEEEMKREARRRVEKVAAEWQRLGQERRQRGNGLAGTRPRLRLWSYGARFGEVVNNIPSVDFSELKDPQKRVLGLLEHDGTHGIILDRMSRHPMFPDKLRELKEILAAGRRGQEVVVGMRCFSGRHRSVAAATIFEYIGQQEGWDVSVEHLDLMPCHCGDCGLSPPTAPLQRAWELWCDL